MSVKQNIRCNELSNINLVFYTSMRVQCHFHKMQRKLIIQYLMDAFVNDIIKLFCYLKVRLQICLWSSKSFGLHSWRTSCNGWPTTPGEERGWPLELTKTKSNKSHLFFEPATYKFQISMRYFLYCYNNERKIWMLC